MLLNTSVFLLGVAIGLLLLLLGLLVGYWFGRRTAIKTEPAQGKQFLEFLQSMSDWTTEFSGDVRDVQEKLNSISQRVRSGEAPREELLKIISSMMVTNRHLQERLQSTEKKLESQTDQLMGYLDEARTDALTGLRNRRSLDKSLEEMFQRWNNQQRSFSLGMIDVDHFKQINDQYGHPAGDAVLQQVARLIRDELSIATVVARYGGEEFCILTYSSVEEAAREVDRIRKVAASIPLEVDGVKIRVTLSGGLAQVLPEESNEKLVQRADEALYAAKTGGRNRVYLHDGQQCRLVSLSEETSPEMSASEASPPLLEPIAADDKFSHAQERLRRIVEEETQRIIER